MKKTKRGSLIQCSAQDCESTVTYKGGSTKVLCINCWRLGARQRAEARSERDKQDTIARSSGERQLNSGSVRPAHVVGQINTESWYETCNDAFVKAMNSKYRGKRFEDIKLRNDAGCGHVR